MRISGAAFCLCFVFATGASRAATAPTVPAIAGLSPTVIVTGLGYTIDIKGSGFLRTSRVMWNGAAVTFKFISNRDLQVSGAATMAAGANVSITVVNPNPSRRAISSNTASLSVTAPVQVTITPNGGTIRCGAKLAFTAHVANSTDQAVAWQVNGITGGNTSVGAIAATGTYTAAANLPNPPSVMIAAVSHADATAKASVTVNLQNPQPAITSAAPNAVNPGSATLMIDGTGFADGATVYFAGAALATTFVSNTKLTATGTLAMPVGRSAAVKVVNPNPGSLTSAPVVVPVRVANEKMSYSDAVRFLEKATFGPTPASVVELQTIGRDAWLAAQFAKPPSAWPDPLDPTEGAARLQTAFFNTALNGDDQLRQRASFALAQIMVTSAIKDTQFQQMVAYQRLLGNVAFGKFRDLLGAMTLNPAMGVFLDMVNNDKANPTKGTVANENYAREVMQLFTIDLVQLNPDGTPVLLNGATVPEYDQSTVTQMAKVMTGWTFAPEPGFASHWVNQTYYFAPMVPFDEHHDQTEKNLSLPLPCMIGAGGTAIADLNQALDCLCAQSNVAPFIAYRLIQRFVMSDPSPAYVSRVGSVFRSSGGDLQAVITAVLTDSEAATEGSGKLDEPVLYATRLLRALNAANAGADALNAQATAMGQSVLAPGSVFSYFSPYYRIPGMAPPPLAPEFQAVNAATAFARANFAYRAVTNGISASIKVDLSNLQDLAVHPADLVEAIDQALYRGEMDSSVKSILTTAATGSTSTLSRVRSALYAAAAAPQYQVER